MVNLLTAVIFHFLGLIFNLYPIILFIHLVKEFIHCLLIGLCHLHT